MSANYRRLLLALLITAGILNYADRQIIAVFKPLLQEQLHWSDRDYGDLTAVFPVAAVCALLGLAGSSIGSFGGEPIRSPSGSGASPRCFTPSRARWANLPWRVSRSA